MLVLPGLRQSGITPLQPHCQRLTLRISLPERIPDVPEPPSKQLQNVLFGQKLCTPGDVRRCSSRVRRLSRDLPTFDSVWLDALVQSRVLTAYQAQAIESDEAGHLAIGPCVVLDRLGRSSQACTFLARHRTTREPCVIKQVSISLELAGRTLAALNSLVERGRTIEQAGLVIPQAASEQSLNPAPPSGTEQVSSGPVVSTTRLNIVSRYCEALSLSQLILRRGRIPAGTVLNIARQLLESLAVLHESGLVHGDVSLSNALLARNGQVVLVDCGVLAAVRPEFQINSAETPERYDGVAPELIGTGRPVSPSSDLYALGCLLWHLLAGRSAFPTGDPLARLAAHQTERIPDIRELAPETPDALAEAVLWLTEPNWRHRPASAKSVLSSARGTQRRTEALAEMDGPPAVSDSVTGDVRKRPKSVKPIAPSRATLGPPKVSGRRTLSSFAQSFQHPALQTAGRTRSRPFIRSIAAAVAALVLAGVALFSLEPNTRNLVLTFMPALGDARPEVSPDAAVESAPPVRDLPEPDEFGLIELSSPGPWRLTPVTWTRETPLTIRSTSSEPARLLIGDRPLQIRASAIVLDGLFLEQSDPGSALTTIALLQSQTLTIRGCTFLSPDVLARDGEAAGNPHGAAEPRYAVGWQALDSSDRLAGQITIENSVFAGGWSSIWLDETAKPVNVKNTLKVGVSPFFIFEQPARRGASRSLFLKNVTLRDAGPVVAARLIRNWLWETRLNLSLHDCVIDLASQESGRRPLFLFEGETLPRNWQSTFVIDGAGSFVRPGTSLAGIEHGTRHAVLPAEDVDVRGLSTADFTFRDAADALPPGASIIDQLQANRRTPEPPGIQTVGGQLRLPVSESGGEL